MRRRLGLVGPQPDCVGVFIFMTAGPAVESLRGGGTGWAGLEQGGTGAGSAVCTHVLSNPPLFTCLLLFSSWIVAVSGLQHLLHLLHSKYTRRQAMTTHKPLLVSTVSSTLILIWLRTSQFIRRGNIWSQKSASWDLLLLMFPLFFHSKLCNKVKLSKQTLISELVQMC